MATETPQTRKWPKRVLIAIALTVFILVILSVMARLMMRSPLGHDFVERRIEALAPAGQSIELSGIEGDLLDSFTITNVSVSDSEKTWMTAKDVKVSWSPWALFRRKIILQNLSASSVHIDYKPDVISADEPLNLPFNSYALEAFNIPELSLSKDVIGRQVNIQTSGKARYDNSGGALTLNGRTLGAQLLDKADIDLKWSPEFLLSGDAEIIGEGGGLISEILDLGTQETIRLDIKTIGEQKDLTTQIKGWLGEQSFIEGEIRKLDDTAEIQAELSPQIIPKTESFADIFGGNITIDATVDGLNKDAVLKAYLKAPKIDITLTAEKSKNGFVFPQLAISARSPLSTFPDIPASIDAVFLTGSGIFENAISFEGKVSGESIRYDNYKLSSASGALSLELKDTLMAFETDLIGEIATSEVMSDLAGVLPKVQARGLYDFQSKVLTLRRSDINLPGLKLSAQGMASLTESTADMSGRFAVEKDVFDLKLPASLRGTFKTETVNGKIALDVTGDAFSFDTLPAPLPQLMGPQLAFTSNAFIDAKTGVTLRKFSVKGDDFLVSGNGEYGFDNLLQTEVKFKTGGFTIGNVNLTGLDGTADISGALGALDFDIGAQAPQITAANQSVSNVTLLAKGKQVGSSLKADLNVIGQSDKGPVSFTTQAAYENGAWQASNTEAALGDLAFAGNLSGLGGDITQLTAAIKISGNPSAFIPAGAVELDVQLSDRVVDVSGQIRDINIGPLSEAELTLEARGPRGAVNFNLDLTGTTLIADISRDLKLSTSGLADTNVSDASVTANLSGSLGQYEVKAAKPLMLTQTRDGFVGDGAFSVFGGKIAFMLDDQPQSLSLTGDALKLADIMILLGRAGVEGRGGFEAKLQRSMNKIESDFLGTLNGVRQPGSDADVLDAVFTAQLKNELLDFRAESTSGALSGQTTLNGSVSTSPKPPFVTWPPSSPLRGEATAKGNIGSLMELFLPPETNMKGNLNLDMRYSLPLDARGMRGSMSMTGGVFEQGSIGLTLDDMTLASIFDGTTISVSEFSAKDGKGGSLTGNGKMDIGFANGSAINLSANRLHVFNRREGFAVLSGDLKLNHTGEKLALKGGLIVDDASVSVDKFPRAGRPTLDVSFSDALDEQDKVVRTATELDVKITSPSRIKLTGRGVNASMSLDVHVTGAFNDPVLAGEAQITRGRFDFLGKRFALNDSKVIFNDRIMDSRLDIAAIRETSDLTATVNVIGTLSRPEISMESTPQLPEDEVIARILFGRSASQLTTIETARLAAALAQLSGGGGFDLLGGLENALGLDTLDFGQSDSGQTQLTTGKYLSDNVYVEVRSSAEGTPGLAVEWTPKKHISIEAETAPGETQRVSVQWQTDFD